MRQRHEARDTRCVTRAATHVVLSLHTWDCRQGPEPVFVYHLQICSDRGCWKAVSSELIETGRTKLVANFVWTHLHSLRGRQPHSAPSLDHSVFTPDRVGQECCRPSIRMVSSILFSGCDLSAMAEEDRADRWRLRSLAHEPKLGSNFRDGAETKLCS